MTLFAVDADRGLSFVFGIGLALALLGLIWGGALLWRRGHALFVGVLGLLAFVAANVVMTMLIINPRQSVWDALRSRMMALRPAAIISYGGQGRALNRDPVQVTAYHLTLTPVDAALTAFEVTVNLGFQDDGQAKTLSRTLPTPARAAKSAQGWLLREVRLELPEKTVAQFAWSEAGTSREAANVCCFRPVTIRLKNIPKGAFYEARDADGLRTTAYADTETVEWQVLDPWGEREHAEFSLVPPPYHRFPFLRRVASLSSVADWVFTLGGMLGSSLLVSLLIPVFKDLGKQRVKRALSPQSSTPKTGAPAGNDPALAALAHHLSDRLRPDQLTALRDEIDALLPPKSP